MTPIADPERPMHRVAADAAWVQGDVISPQAFLPRPKDRNKLSLLDTGQTAAEALNSWRIAFPNSKATTTLTHRAQSYAALYVPLGETPTTRLPTHCTADYTGLCTEDAEVVAALLAENPAIGP